jgi:hypothetical protein
MINALQLPPICLLRIPYSGSPTCTMHSALEPSTVGPDLDLDSDLSGRGLYHILDVVVVLGIPVPEITHPS